MYRRYSNTYPQEIQENFRAILRVNQTMRREALPVMYQHVRLVLPSIEPLDHKYATEELLSRIRTLELIPRKPKKNKVYIDFDRLPSLETLILSVWDEHNVEIALLHAAGHVLEDSLCLHEYLTKVCEYTTEIEWILALRKDSARTFRVFCRPVSTDQEDDYFWNPSRSPSHKHKTGFSLVPAAKQSRFIDICDGEDADFQYEEAIWISDSDCCN